MNKLQKKEERKQLAEFLKYYGLQVVEGIEQNRLKEPLKEEYQEEPTERKSSYILEIIKGAEESRCNTRIAISILHRAYEELKEKDKQIIKMRFKEREKIYYISKSISRGDTQTRIIYYKALDKMIDSYKIFDISRIDKSLYSDKYFDFII